MKRLLILFLFLSFIISACAGLQSKSPSVFDQAEHAGAATKISDLSELSETPASDDIIPIVDISDTTMAASGTNKKITITNLHTLSSGNMITGQSGVTIDDILDEDDMASDDPNALATQQSILAKINSSIPSESTVEGYMFDNDQDTNAGNWINTGQQEFQSGITIDGYVALFETPLTSAPTPLDGRIYCADNSSWDPISYTGSVPYLVIYDGSNYIGLWDKDGNMILSTLTLPNGDNPTTDAEGEIAQDNDDGCIEIYLVNNSGVTSSHLICATRSETWVFPTPDDMYSAATQWPIPQFPSTSSPHGVWITRIEITSSSAITNDTFTIYEFANPDGTGTPSTVEAIDMSGVTNSSVAYADIDDSDIAAGYSLFLGLGDDDVVWVKVVIDYAIKEGD